ncbi:CpsD/CapB family tyrosine-protein kinase [Dehalobacter sp.]|uniref:tyrosine-protein kinase family protein n=1 Tax=Dehalobacter sp. TaxID=1962289 RepID=UPI002586A0FD|nr:CpsD/CapB family tyrosine-protein kinase [Dehalobacter sp.]MDJ0304958.1 CpsD/CapB family tyrosine-protein kinase [Dehalobacter sp.]
MQIKNFNVYHHQNKAVQDAYEMLTVNIHINNSQDRLKTFALTSCLPEEGKTSLAISLAISIAHSGWKVLLIDADMRKPTAAKRLNDQSQHGLSNYLTGKVDLNDVICGTNISNLHYCSCGSDHTNPVELLCSNRFQEIINKTQSMYDFVIFDTPSLESVIDAGIIASKVNAALLVVKMGSTSLRSIARAKDQLESLNAKILGIVLNRVKRRDYKRYVSSYNYFFNPKRFLKRKPKRTYSPLEDGTQKNLAQ